MDGTSRISLASPAIDTRSKAGKVGARSKYVVCFLPAVFVEELL